jgi:L-ascorbate metabolism protein UlaG (beta-lactamase superfamily)
MGRVSSGGTGAKKTRSKGALGVPTSLESAFLLDSPGEYEVHHVLINGIRTFRDEEVGEVRGTNTCFVFELDNVHVVHLGDVGHLLTQDQLGEIGAIDVACVAIGGSLSAARAAELVAQLDAKMIVPMPLNGSAEADGELSRFLHEMSVTQSEPAPKLTVTSSSLPAETTVVVLESRSRS